MPGRFGLSVAVQKLVWCVAPLLALTMVGCGGSEYRFPGHKPKPEVTGVAATCSPTTIHPGQNSQCSATVSGTGAISTAVTWSASAGVLSTSGLFAAPPVQAT